MSQGIISVTLNRDGPTTPWGFRLHGGKDIGYPLAIQRVFLGSPSEGELHRGDVILQVSDRDTADLSHMEAHDVIKSAGNQLRLLVHRLPGAPQSPSAYSPSASPGFMRSGQHPLASVTPTPAAAFKASSFQPMLPPRVTPTTQNPASQGWGAKPKEYCFSPLPTTPVLENQPPAGGFFSPSPQNARLNEAQEFRQENTREKAAIVHQGYRTFPLISPKPKTRHDVPIGSYLRHVQDPSWRGRVSAAPTPRPFFMNQFPTQTYSARGGSSSGGGYGVPSAPQPAGDGPQLVHRQYNSPMNLYSQENLNETIHEQTGMQPKTKPNTPLPPLTTAFNPSGSQGAPLSPVPAGGTLAPAKPGTKLTNIVDITLSPTFQMIQESENRAASPRPDPRTPPVLTRSPASAAATGGAPRSCGFEQERVNTFGSSRELIHQSGSFKTLMATLSMPGQQEF